MGEVVQLGDYFKENKTEDKRSLKNNEPTINVENKVLSYPNSSYSSKTDSVEDIFNPNVEKRDSIEKHTEKNLFQNIIDKIKQYISFKTNKNQFSPFIDNDYLIESKIDGSQLVRADKIESMVDFILKGGSGKVEELGYYDTGYTIGDFIEASKGETVKDQTKTTYLSLSDEESKGMIGILDLYFGDKFCPEYFIDPYSDEFLYESLGSIIYDYCKYFHSPSDDEDIKVCKELGCPNSYDRSDIETIIIPEHGSEEAHRYGDAQIRLSNCMSLLSFLDGTNLEQFETEENMKETLIQTAKQGYVSHSMVNFLVYEVGTYFHMKNLSENLSKAVGSLDFSKQEKIPKETEKPYLRLV